MVSDVPFWEWIWEWLSQWKFAEISIVASLLIVAATRPAWLLFKLILYSLFSSVSSCRLVVRGCVRVWMWINWDIGSAFFGLLRHSWIVSAGVSLPRLRQVVLDIDYITDSGSSARIASPQMKVPRGDIACTTETGDAISRSSANIASVNKRERYLSLFHTQLKMAIEKWNAKQLEKQARGRWYRVRAVASWIPARIRRFAKCRRR